MPKYVYIFDIEEIPHLYWPIVYMSDLEKLGFDKQDCMYISLFCLCFTNDNDTDETKIKFCMIDMCELSI